MVSELTPVRFAEEIEACADFWVNRLGFNKTIEVPEEGKVGFVILESDGVQVMHQSYASGAKDAPALTEVQRKGPSFLLVHVPDLAKVITAMKGARVAVPECTTFLWIEGIWCL